MRWKLIRRRLSISAPRMIVRSHLPWPLRWAMIALMFGFSAAIALWAFEFGKGIAGIKQDAREEISRLREQVADLREERDKAQAIANTAQSLLKAERVTQEHLAQQLKQAEADAASLKADLGFFEKLLPTAGPTGLGIRSLQAEVRAPGQLRYQMLVMFSGKGPADFTGRTEWQATGFLDGKPWVLNSPAQAQPLSFKQYRRVEGLIDYPAQAIVKSVQFKVFSSDGTLRASETVRL